MTAGLVRDVTVFAHPRVVYPLAATLKVRMPFERNGQPTDVHEIFTGLEHLVHGKTDDADRILGTVLERPGNFKVWNEGDSGGKAKRVLSFSEPLAREARKDLGVANIFFKEYAPHVVHACAELSRVVHEDRNPAQVDRNAFTTQHGVPARLVSLYEGETLAVYLSGALPGMTPAQARETALHYTQLMVEHARAIYEYTRDSRTKALFKDAIPEQYEKKFTDSMRNTAALFDVTLDDRDLAADTARVAERLGNPAYKRNMIDPWTLNYTLPVGASSVRKCDLNEIVLVDADKAFGKLAAAAQLWAHSFFDPVWALTEHSADARMGAFQDFLAADGADPSTAVDALFFWHPRQLGINAPERTRALLGSGSLAGERLRGHLADYAWLLAQPDVQKEYRTAPAMREGVQAYLARP